MEIFGHSLEAIYKELSLESHYKFASVNKLFNAIQQYKKVLIIDFRNGEAFNKTHINGSINIPYNSITMDELTNYSANIFIDKHIANEQDKELYGHRRRLMVFLIPSCSSIQNLYDSIENLKSVNFKEISEQLLNDKNKLIQFQGFLISCLLFQALLKEKVREVYILSEGFRTFLKQFPFLCSFYNNKIYIEPYFLFLRVEKKKKEDISE